MSSAPSADQSRRSALNAQTMPMRSVAIDHSAVACWPFERLAALQQVQKGKRAFRQHERQKRKIWLVGMRGE